MTLALHLPRGRALTLALIAIVAMVGFPMTTPASAADLGPGSLTLSALDVTPSSPTPGYSVEPVHITFRVRNNTSQTLTGVEVTGVRATPIEDQRSLDAAMAHPAEPDAGLLGPIDTGSTVLDPVPAGGTIDAIFSTTVDIARGAGICFCANAIYPLFFTASINQNGSPVTLGTAQTYIPSFKITQPTKLQVGWVWPLLDVPHRLTSSTVFIDDTLAAEVAPGGRLDRALTVLEYVSPTIPMTVMTDPDLLDELQIMAEGNYHVQHDGAADTVGIGSGVAAAWLARLRTVLTDHANTELDLTAYGDPDIEALQHNNLTWTAGLPTDVQARVTAALGGLTPPSDIAWPVDNTLSKATLETLVRQGTQTVIVGNSTLPKVAGSNLSQNALASLTTTSGPATAGLLDSSIETWAAKVLVPNGSGAGYLPQLVAQVALRAVTSTDTSHFVLVTPPRFLDVDPAVAERAIIGTSRTVWAEPMLLRKAAQTLDAQPTSTITPQRTTSLPPRTIEALRYVSSSLPGLSSLFFDEDRQAEIGALPTASQLAASSSLVTNPDQTVLYSNRLRIVVSNIRNGVHLVIARKNSSATGSYTLTSTNSKLPITIANDLGVRVQVNVTASAVGGVPGFAATPIESKTIAAHSTVQVRLPTHFDRTGRIEIQVRLSTPTNLTLGEPIKLSVRSTALGTIGVVITAVAAVVLFGALFVRAAARLRRRARRNARVES